MQKLGHIFICDEHLATHLGS